MRLRTLSSIVLGIVVCFSACNLSFSADTGAGDEFVNSIGIKFVRIKAGSFLMGNDAAPLSDDLAKRARLKNGDYDEMPVHKVTISQAFYIGETEVTIAQYRQFEKDFPGFKAKLDYDPYVSGISWYDAVEFCKWLSKKEDRVYRLPTEAEWEYVCKAGTSTPFSSGDTKPDDETANPWGVKNMHTGVLEWCLDWHGLYSESEQIDPVGPENSWTKVVRGGGLDYIDAGTMSFYFGRDYGPWVQGARPYYRRSANRAAMPPNFAPPPREYQAKQMAGINPASAPGPQLSSPYRAKGLVSGWHCIGFRVVAGVMPATKPTRADKPFFQRCVKQAKAMVRQGPELSKPYYRTVLLFPRLSSEQMVKVGWKCGLQPGLGTNQHNGALVALDNGDLLATYYNGFTESDPDLSLLVMRLRHGSRDWDIPSAWPDFLDGNDASPFIWNDNGTIWLGWGCPHLSGGYPFQWVSSSDNGATWSAVHFPVFDSRPGGYGRRQPINAAFRGPDKTIYIAFDGWGSTGGLWASSNNGKTWYDTGGRMLGLHCTFALLDDNSILAFGTRNRTIDGFCPRNVSTDFGRTWNVSRSPVPGQGGGQNPVMIKLASGRLLYVSNFSRARDPNVKGFAGPGAYAGLSEDQGRSWRLRKLVGGNTVDESGNPVKFTSVGYVGITQTANGLIHIVTSRNRPNLYAVLNEAWILADDKAAAEAAAKAAASIVPGSVKEYEEKYDNGKVKARWSAGVGNDGTYLLDGTETHYYPNGRKQWQVNFRAGEKVGGEMYWNALGLQRWRWDYDVDGVDILTLYDRDGEVKARSQWKRNKFLNCHFTGKTGLRR